MNQKVERPEYVANFAKDKNTEIKYIHGNWYLYSRISIWDSINKKRTKKSGPIIGRITPEGLVPSEHRKHAPKEPGISVACPESAASCLESTEQLGADHEAGVGAVVEVKRTLEQKLDAIEAKRSASGLAEIRESQAAPGYTVPQKESVVSDVVEAGVIVYLIRRTERIRLILQSVFPESWVYIYVMALLRAVYVCPLRELQLEYNHSLLHYLYPKVSLRKQYVANIIYALGSMRGKIREFMQLEMEKSYQYLILDGHRMLTSGSDMPLKSVGYDLQLRFQDQLNVLYAFSTNNDGTIGTPSFYRQFAGNTIDSIALKSMIVELKVAEGQIAIGDKGMGSTDRFDQMSGIGLRYIVPLKRNNTEIKGLNLGLASAYPGQFMYKDNRIKYIALSKTDYRIIVFLDQYKRADESAAAGRKFEKANNKDLEEAIKAMDKINADISRCQKQKEKFEKDIDKKKSNHQKAVDQLNEADLKFQNKQAALSATQLRLDNARQKLENCKAKNASQEKIDSAQHSVDFQSASLTKRNAEFAHAQYVLLTKKKQEAAILDELNGLNDKLEKAKQDLDQLNLDLVVLERYKDTCQGAVDHGLTKYMKDGEYVLADPDEEDLESCSEDLFGTLTIRTTVMDMTAEKIFRLYKMRQSIEQFFKTYDNTLCQDVSYLSNQFSEEGWLFLNHLSSLIAYDTLKHIHEVGEDDDLSIRGWYKTLRGIQAVRMEDGSWDFGHLAQDTADRCKKFGFNPTDIASLGIK